MVPPGWGVRRGRSRVLAVVVLAVLAGCGGFSPGGGSGDTPTLTPAPVPDVAEPVAGGVSTDGVDPGTVVLNHHEALDNRSYVVRETLRAGIDNETVFHDRTVVEMGADGRFSRDVTVIEAPNDFLGRGTDVWWNGERAVYRYTFQGGREVYYYVNQHPGVDLRFDRRFTRALRSFSVSRVRQGPGNVTVVSGRIDASAGVPRTDFMTAIENASMSFRIRPNGLVDRAAIGYDANHHDDGRRSVRFTYRVGAVGRTSASPPSWVGNVTLNED